MGRSIFRGFVIAMLLGSVSFPASAQEANTATTQTANASSLTAAELQRLMAPIALYPDTVLIQILIAATAPLDVVKADRLLGANPAAPVAGLDQKIKAAGFDLSVEVLALGFPTVIREMAVHIDWTETVGVAMLAQSEDVLAAVQVMRPAAINTGALVTTPEVVVSKDPVTSTVIVQPANPQVVYIPQYEPTATFSNPVGNALVTGLVLYGTVTLIDEIFDNNDDWNDYWGCRNCGGWEDGVIIRNPDIDIDVNGNVNIGNNINAVWKPDNDRVGIARDEISVRRGPDGATRLDLDRPATRSDELRASLGSGTPRDGAGRAAGTTLADRSNSAAGKLANRTPGAKPITTPRTKQRPAATTTGAARAEPKLARTDTGENTRTASTRGRLSTSKARK